MSDTPDPFELEPEDAQAVRGPRPAPAAPPEPKVAPDESGVDIRTVAERRGEALARGARERVPNPPGWPVEALSFPFRRPGPGFLALAIGGFVLLDLAGMHQGLRFPGWVLKLLMVMYVLRAQFHVIGTSAAGRDTPEGWTSALEFDREKLTRYVRTIFLFAGALLPGSLLWMLFDKIAPGLVLLLLGSMYATVIAMGAALQDPSLKWPWHALRWITTRPLHCLLGSLAYWMLLGSEFALYGLYDEAHPVLVGFVSLVLRFVCMAGLLVSARIIGVMARAWTA